MTMIWLNYMLVRFLLIILQSWWVEEWSYREPNSQDCACVFCLDKDSVDDGSFKYLGNYVEGGTQVISSFAAFMNGYDFRKFPGGGEMCREKHCVEYIDNFWDGKGCDWGCLLDLGLYF